MIPNDIKNEVNNLHTSYVTENNKEKCIDKLFILIYYHPKKFGIKMNEENLNDFRFTLYPKIIEKIFSKYDKEKASFFTFVCMCLKNHAKAFLRKIYLKNAIDETILKEITNAENSKTIDKDNSTSESNDLERNNEADSDIDYEENNMKKALSEWISKTNSLQRRKNYKQAIFVLSCKIAYVLDEKMIKKIADYIEMPENIMRYYVSRLNLEYANSSNARKILEAKNRRDKYFIRKTSVENLLNTENLSESGKSVLECTKKYSIQKYKIACKKLETQKQSLSNRKIAKITGISRSMIDRIIIGIPDILKYCPCIDEK